VGLTFEWDEKKAAANRRKHGVSFEEAASAFGDPLSLTIPDPEHSEDEQRCVLLGMTEGHRLVVVCPPHQRQARDAGGETRL